MTSTLARGAYDHHTTAAKVRPLAEWRYESACTGKANVMDTPALQAHALALCRSCPVLDTCKADVMGLPEALDLGGVCGGMTSRERAKARLVANAPDDTPRVCTKCREVKTNDDFYSKSNGRDNLSGHCKACHAVKARAYRAARRG